MVSIDGPTKSEFGLGRKWHTSALETVRRHSLLTRTTGLFICLFVTYVGGAAFEFLGEL